MKKIIIGFLIVGLLTGCISPKEQEEKMETIDSVTVLPFLIYQPHTTEDGGYVSEGWYKDKDGWHKWIVLWSITGEETVYIDGVQQPPI